MRRYVMPLVVLVSLSSSGIAAATPLPPRPSPITPANRPTPLVGQVNGVVSPARLVGVAPHCIAAREAGPSLARIFAMAREAKIGLGADECYRPLAEEVKFANQAAQPGNNPACVASVSHTATGKPVGNSYHGWGKAVDLVEDGNSLTFADPGYAFMKRVAGSLGWNHPAFAEPGGSSCPEPWHWEWVGDGGSLHLGSVAVLPSADDKGFAVVRGLGVMQPSGDFISRGSPASTPIASVIVGATATPNRGGYWMVGADGGVFGYGNARFYGSAARLRLAQPVNGITPSASGRGYWLLAWDGGVFGYGDAHFYGSTGNRRLNAPIDGMAATPSGRGYWLVASDGGIFAYGDAHFFGSTGRIRLAAPIVGMAATPTGKGYWLIASDGGVFGFGDAHFYGSAASARQASPIVALTPTRTGRGYWIMRADGQVFAYGDAMPGPAIG
jgi:hypothetical protein